MRRSIIIVLLLQLIAIMFLTGTVNAVDNPCKISLSTNKTTLKPGDEITVNISISDITMDEGVNNIIAVINYSKDVFQIIYDESEEAEEQVALISESRDSEGNVAMFYLGENDTSSTKSNWNGLVYEDPTGQEGVMFYTGDKQKTSQTMAKMKLKVKDNAPKTNTKLALESIAVYDSNNTEHPVNDTSISFSIDGIEVIKNDPPANTVEQNNLVNNVNNNNNNMKNDNANNDIADKDAPNTGIEDYVPAFFLILIIAMFSYINYRKYKDI